MRENGDIEDIDEGIRERLRILMRENEDIEEGKTEIDEGMRERLRILMRKNEDIDEGIERLRVLRRERLRILITDIHRNT